jgi:hypothetical protein
MGHNTSTAEPLLFRNKIVNTKCCKIEAIAIALLHSRVLTICYFPQLTMLSNCFFSIYFAITVGLELRAVFDMIVFCVLC